MSAKRLCAIALATGLALAACTGEDSDGDDGSQAASGPGLDSCVEDPNACNAGDRDDGGTITWVVVSEPQGWNTYSPEGGSVYTLQILHGIYPHTGTFAPDRETWQWNMDLLAEEPELLSDDPQTWQYTIRDEAEWDDGTPITADDFMVSWKLGTNDAEGHCTGCRSRSTGAFDQIESVDGSDDGKTVTFTLKDGQANPEWFVLFSPEDIGSGLMPAHIARENGFDIDTPRGIGQFFEWLQETRPTFSGGPYKVAEGDFAEQVIMEPNPNWYGAEQPTFDTMVLRVITDQGSWIPALTNGEVHGAAPVQLNEDVIRSLEGMPDVYSLIQPGPSWEHVDFNMDVQEFLDVALRRAIFTAIDAEEITQVNFGELFPDVTLRKNHLFRSDSEFFVDHISDTGQGSGDEAAALDILEEAGYEFDGTTLTKDGEQIGPFRLRSTSDQARATSMELIQSHLAEIGVDVTIEPTDDLGGMLGQQDYDIAQYGWSGPPTFFGNAFTYWNSASGSNFGKYSNPEVDRLTEEELTKTTQEEAAEVANQAMELVAEDAYVLPLYDTPVFMFVSDDYADIRDNTASSTRSLFNNHEWGVAVQ